VSARAPRQPSEATSCTHFPAVQICITLSATQNPAPSLKDRPAHAQPLAGTGTSAGKYGGGWSASWGDGAGWARAAESNRALIKIDLASIRISIIAPRSPVVDALPSNARRWIHNSRVLTARPISTRLDLIDFKKGVFGAGMRHDSADLAGSEALRLVPV